MKIIEVNNRKYIDKELFDYICNIWLTFDQKVENDSNLYFAKNTTVDRRITDYIESGIRRVIKKEKADYLVINMFSLNSYPQFYDGVSIVSDNSKEDVYAIYNYTIEVQETIELILDFITRGQKVKYIDQNRLNESVNNGFIIDNDSYIMLKELIDSGNEDNLSIAANIVMKSDLKNNKDWLLYLYFNRPNDLFKFDPKHTVFHYLKTIPGFENVGSNKNVSNPFSNVDKALSIIRNKDVKNRFLAQINSKFQQHIAVYLKEHCGTENFKLNDFKIDYVGEDNTNQI